MTDPSDNLVLEHLRHIRAAVDDVRSELRELKTRVGRMEVNIAQLHEQGAEHSVRMDKIDGRLDRIERRLQLQDA